MTDQQLRDRAVALKADGWSVRRIAAELAVGKTTVQDWLQTSERRSMGDVSALAAARRADVIRLHGEELSIRQIAYEADISPTHVARILREEGLTANGYQG